MSNPTKRRIDDLRKRPSSRAKDRCLSTAAELNMYAVTSRLSRLRQGQRAASRALHAQAAIRCHPGPDARQTIRGHWRPPTPRSLLQLASRNSGATALRRCYSTAGTVVAMRTRTVALPFSVLAAAAGLGGGAYAASQPDSLSSAQGFRLRVRTGVHRGCGAAPARSSHPAHRRPQTRAD